ncbi:MAG: hypothetical protein ACLRM8_00170 [Alistipes sp.]
MQRAEARTSWSMATASPFLVGLIYDPFSGIRAWPVSRQTRTCSSSSPLSRASVVSAS